MKKCQYCKNSPPAVKRSQSQNLCCVPCFLSNFEKEIYQTIISEKLFKPNETVIIGISGGKDSTVLAYTINKINIDYDLKLNIKLVAIDEGIIGYRDGSLETVKENAKDLKLDLEILSFKELYGYTMDEIIKISGYENSCTYCGVLRRHALDHSANILNVKKIVTGHNADDIAETVLMNFCRGDYNRLPMSVKASTGDEENDDIIRIKPFKYIFEKEIVMYAYYKKLKYFCTECTYARGAYRGHVRELIKEIERIRPAGIIDIIHSGEYFTIDKEVKTRKNMRCEKCGHISSNKLCKCCLLLEKLKNKINK